MMSLIIAFSIAICKLFCFTNCSATNAGGSLTLFGYPSLSMHENKGTSIGDGNENSACYACDLSRMESITARSIMLMLGFA